MNITFDDISAGFALGIWKLFQFLRAALLYWIFKLLAQEKKYSKLSLGVGAIILAAILGIWFGDPTNANTTDFDYNGGYGSREDNPPEVYFTHRYIHQNTVGIFVGVLGVTSIGILSGIYTRAKNKEDGY